MSTNNYSIKNNNLILQISCKTGVYDILLDIEDYDKLITKKWNIIKNRNGVCSVRHSYYKNKKHMCLYIHRYVLNYSDNLVIDHINGNPLDNRKCNLRICTNQENCRNQKVAKHSSGGIKGVSYNKNNKKWTARIGLNYTRIFLGYFNTKVDAAIAYNKKAIELYGEFAKLNEVNNV